MDARHRLARLLLALVLAGGATGCDLAPTGSTGVGDLTELADHYETDKGTAGHRFTGAYELFFLPIRQDVRKVFEIGVLRGASMRMFRDYFPNATIYGADIEDKSTLDSERTRTIVADQGRREDLARLIELHGSDYDIMIDDGGHTMEQQQTSFGFLFPHVRPGGYYIIEDVHTSLSSHYGVLPDRSNTTLTMFFRYLTERRISSEYMTQEEMAYATEHIDFCHLHVGNDAKSLAWIIKKK